MKRWLRHDLVAATFALLALTAAAVFVRFRPDTSNGPTANTAVRVTPALNAPTLDLATAAPAVSIPGLDGAAVDPSRLSEGVVILAFWRTDCTDCQPLLDTLETIAPSYPGTVRVLAVDRGEPHEMVSSAAADRWPHLTVLLDPDEAVSRAYGTGSLPATYFLRQGIIVGLGLGPLTSDQLRTRLADLL